MQTVDTLVHTRWLITCEEQNKILENHSMAIKDGKILAILPTTEANMKYSATNQHPYKTHVVMAGLINAHTHIAMNIFRGLADDLDLMDWLKNFIWPAETKWVSKELVYDASLLAMAEMIRGGTTCFNDMYFFMDATAEAAKLSGMRAHIGMTIIDVPTAWAKTPEEYFARAIEFYQQYRNHPLIKPTLAPHSTYTVSIENLKKCNDLAKEHHLKINLHLQEAPAEIEISMDKYRKRPLQRLNEIGMVSPDLIAIHMTQINNDDIAILKKTKPNIINCPESNMKLVSGYCPVHQFTEMGLNVALGTDGAASNNDLDMFGEMRTAAFVGKVKADDPKAVPAETVLKMATINGAKALGIEAITGSLTPGKSADFIAINMEEIETQPLYHIVSQVVYAASRYQVSDTWVAGKQLMKDRQLLTLDPKHLLEKAQMWRKKIEV